MVDEKELKEAMRDHVGHITERMGEGLHLVDLEQAHGIFIEIIDAQPKTGEWIPADERLPEEEGNYLCTLEGELCGMTEPFTGMCGFADGRWDEDCVLAWMPLPEPWEGGK